MEPATPSRLLEQKTGFLPSRRSTWTTDPRFGLARWGRPGASLSTWRPPTTVNTMSSMSHHGRRPSPRCRSPSVQAPARGDRRTPPRVWNATCPWLSLADDSRLVGCRPDRPRPYEETCFLGRGPWFQAHTGPRGLRRRADRHDQNAATIRPHPTTPRPLPQGPIHVPLQLGIAGHPPTLPLRVADPLADRRGRFDRRRRTPTMRASSIASSA